MIRRRREALLRSLRRGLEERAAALSRSVSSDLEELGRSGEEHHLADLDDLGGDALDQEATFALMQLESDQLEQIGWALERIDAGTYGLCEDCGQEIREARLVALPLATRCVRCQSAAETGVPVSAREVEEAAEGPEEPEEPAPDERFALLEDAQAAVEEAEEEEEEEEEEPPYGD